MGAVPPRRRLHPTVARRGRRRPGSCWGWCLFLSYGLALFGLLALAVFALTRAWGVLPWAALGVAAVVGMFWMAGFTWWDAYPALRERYYDGVGGERPYQYWVWAGFAAWTFTVGLATWAAFPRMWIARAAEEADRRRWRSPRSPPWSIASLSAMSKAEVERIWLPFTLWIVTVPALLPPTWRRPLLLSQVVLAVLAQTLLRDEMVTHD